MIDYKKRYRYLRMVILATISRKWNNARLHEDMKEVLKRAETI